jgi:D-sedoheptulose 7-phosphate isomerase
MASEKSSEMRTHIHAGLQQSSAALAKLMTNDVALGAIERAAQCLIGAFRQRNRVFSCGNGGSMSDAMHFAEELTGRYRLNRRGLPATAISDAGHLTCVANDFGYEQVFSRYVEAHGSTGDVLVGISTSGTSRNIILAAQAAKAIGMRVITLTGREGSALAQLADIDICTPGGQFADRVQELHIKVIHLLIELVEREFFPENYR